MQGSWCDNVTIVFFLYDFFRDETPARLLHASLHLAALGARLFEWWHVYTGSITSSDSGHSTTSHCSTGEGLIHPYQRCPSPPRPPIGMYEFFFSTSLSFNRPTRSLDLWQLTRFVDYFCFFLFRHLKTTLIHFFHLGFPLFRFIRKKNISVHCFPIFWSGTPIRKMFVSNNTSFQAWFCWFFSCCFVLEM